MNPDIDRILREQAEQAGAAGDMEFLGYAYPHAPRPRGPDLSPIPQRLGEPYRPPREVDPLEAALMTHGEQLDSFLGMNQQALRANLWRLGLTPPHEWDSLEWDKELTYGRMLEDLGIEGARNLAAQGALSILEPGPGQLAQLAAVIPQRLLQTFGKLSKGGMARPYFHASPYVPKGDMLPSKSGDLGPGLYITHDAPYAGLYTEERALGIMGSRSPVATARAANIRPGYVSGRMLDVDDLNSMTTSQARTLLEPIRVKRPGFYEDMMRKARRGQLSEAELWREAYDLDIQSGLWSDDFDPGIANEPNWIAGDGNELLRDMGYVGAYSNRMSEGVVWNPAQHYIAPWDVEGMLKAISQSDIVPPEEVFEISQEVAEWMSRWSSQ